MTTLPAIPPKRLTTDDIGSEWGFRLLWSVQDHWADVRVYEKVYTDPMEGALFAKEGWQALPDDCTPDPEKAETYLKGYVKWDGCTELSFGHQHWCGAEGYRKHIALLTYIHHRAHELMGVQPLSDWGKSEPGF